MEIKKEIWWLGNRQPLAVISDGKVIIYSKFGFFLMDQDGRQKKICSLEMTIGSALKEIFFLTRRLFRKEIRCSCLINANELYFFKDRILYVLFISEKKVKKIYSLKHNQSMPLNITKGNGDFIILWGQYGNNKERSPVSIYGLTKQRKIRVVYTFAKGQIRHIHNIVSNKNKGYLIFTGDNDAYAGIYRADRLFNSVIPVLIGEQQARSVAGFWTKDGILYATDSVTEENHIYLLRRSEAFSINRQNQDNWEKREICRINGSCIYATEFAGGYLFSTCVESPETLSDSWRSYISCKRGSGILSDNVEMVYINRKYEYKVITSFKKDRLPYKLFQYGAIKFATGMEHSEAIFFYPVAVKKYDGKMGLLKIISGG